MGVVEPLLDHGYTITAPVDLNELCQLAVWVDHSGECVLDLSVGKLFLEFFETTISGGLHLEVIRTLVVSEDRPVDALSSDHVLVRVVDLLARQVHLQRH
jgi:hypothetical protein